MYKRRKIKKLGRKTAHRKSLLRNLVISLFTHGYVETTSVKAKALRREAETVSNKYTKMADKLTRRRELAQYFGNNDKALENFESLAKDVRVSIVKTRFRDGDKAEMSKVIVLGLDKKSAKIATKKKETKVDSASKKKKDQGKLDSKAKKGGIADTVKQAFSGSKERARSRSGL